MTELDRALIAILATGDAAHIPNRRARPVGRLTTRYESQQRYRRRGVRLPGVLARGSANQAGRKGGQRLIDAMVDARLIDRFSSGGRTIGVWLTPVGEFRSRCCCKLPTYGDAIPWLAGLLELHQGPLPVEEHGLRLIMETIPAKTAYGSPGHVDAIAGLQDALLPLLVRDLVGSESTDEISQGRVFYYLTPTGVELAERLAAGKTTISEPVKRPRWTKNARSLYYSQRREECNAFDTRRPENRNELGSVPLSAWVADQAECRIRQVANPAGCRGCECLEFIKVEYPEAGAAAGKNGKSSNRNSCWEDPAGDSLA